MDNFILDERQTVRLKGFITMALYTFNNNQSAEVSNTKFEIEKIFEREVQAVLRDKIDVISPDH